MGTVRPAGGGTAPPPCSWHGSALVTGRSKTILEGCMTVGDAGREARARDPPSAGRTPAVKGGSIGFSNGRSGVVKPGRKVRGENHAGRTDR